MLGLCPTRLPGRVSPVPRSSFETCHRPLPRKESSTPSGLAEYCLLPSLRHDRLGPFKHLSADTMTWLQRSLNVAARFLAPLFQGLTPGSYGRISPPAWSLLPGAPALTRTDLSSARKSRLAGRTMVRVYGSPWIAFGAIASDAIAFCSAFVFGRIGDLHSRYLAPGCKRVRLRNG